MEIERNEADRRWRRSQLLLKQSFAELMREKGFSEMTIRNITIRADVHRGTFYVHYPDKFALLEHIQTLYGSCSPVDAINLLFERSIRDELAELLRHWLERLRADRADWTVPVDTMALMTSWSIFGAAVQWSKGYEDINVDEMTDGVIAVLTEGAGRIAFKETKL